MIHFQPIRGVVDQFPETNVRWQHIISKLIKSVETIGYREIKLPILEPTELFLRSVGAQSDIVQKEMYSFEDHGKENLCLRPEGTAGCMRAYLNHCQREAPFQRFWYYGPMFRRERPQKGRLRQFYQFGLEVIGYDEVMPEVELLMIGHRLFQEIINGSKLTLEINYLGGKESRARYTEALKDYFSAYKNKFDSDLSKSRSYCLGFDALLVSYAIANNVKGEIRGLLGIYQITSDELIAKSYIN